MTAERYSPGTGGTADGAVGPGPGLGKGAGTAPLAAHPTAAAASRRAGSRRIPSPIGSAAEQPLCGSMRALARETPAGLFEELPHLEVVLRIEQGLRRRLHRLDADRKSTRLNSSHLVISYA